LLGLGWSGWFYPPSRRTIVGGEYQEAGRLLDGVLAGHRIEVMPEDPIGAILMVFKAYRDIGPLVAGPTMTIETELYVQEVIADLEGWLANPILRSNEFPAVGSS